MHREALASASADFQTRQAHLASACEAMLRQIDEQKRDFMAAAQRDLIVLSIAIAGRIAKRIGLIDREAVTENLISVINRVGECSDVVVEVHPLDAETLERFAPEMVAHRSGLRHVEVRVNASIEPGGCVVRTRDGRIDATLAVQLDRIARELVPGRSEALDKELNPFVEAEERAPANQEAAETGSQDASSPHRGAEIQVTERPCSEDGQPG